MEPAAKHQGFAERTDAVSSAARIPNLKILILGGYGVFGGRLAELLSDIPAIDLIISGRDLSRAKAFCAAYEGVARIHPLALDRADIVEGLRAQKPDLVVDASGPFQNYGVDSYRVISACIDAGTDYLDFADASDFVAGVSQFDATGVSSFPVLTAAVLREMAKTMDIVSVEGGVAPSPRAGIGLNVMRAVTSYAGAPVKLRRNGRLLYGIGLAESMRFTVAVPGRLPLRNTRFSLVDVPDLQVIPPEHPAMTDIWMGAGTVPETLLRALNVLATARYKLGLPSLEPLSGLFHRVLNRTRFGEHRGGMFVRAREIADGREVERSWHLLAEGDAGPYIPSMAAEGVIRKMLAGERPAPGARSAVRALELADYDALFRPRTIFTSFRERIADAPLYRKVLGTAFSALPPRLQELHDSTASRQWKGFGEVRRGRGPLAAIAAAFVGFPKAAARVPVTVTFTPKNDAERWTRTFDGKSFSSLQWAGTGRNEHLLMERFGIATFALALVVEGGRLFLVPRRWSVLGIPMPRFLLPSGSTFEAEEDGQFCFNVEISMPLIGLIVAYKGRLEPVSD